MDAITTLKNDHRTVERLFRRFEGAGERAYATKREVVDRIIEELSVHAAIEEQVFYPVVRATVPGTESVTLESLEEHHIVKWQLSELESLSPDDERFDAKVTVLIENVRHHVEEEESDLFPKVRDELGRNALNDLGDALEVARKVAPTHPHPSAPDTPPGNLLVGSAAGMADRVGDRVSGLAQGGVTAVGDVIATVLGRKKPRVTPTGSKVARSTATKVRSQVDDATTAVIDRATEAKRDGRSATRRASRTSTSAARGAKATARSAKGGATKTAKTAKAGAKGTATSARKATKKTATTAKRAATTTRRAAGTAATRSAGTAKRSARQTKATARKPARAA
jgi:hemerythrin superfamily protein